MGAGGPKAEVKAGQALQGSGGTPCFPNAAAKPRKAAKTKAVAYRVSFVHRLTQNWPGATFLIMSWHAQWCSPTPSQRLHVRPVLRAH